MSPNVKTGDLCYLRIRIAGFDQQSRQVMVQVVNRAGLAQSDRVYYVGADDIITKAEAQRAIGASK